MSKAQMWTDKMHQELYLFDKTPKQKRSVMMIKYGGLSVSTKKYTKNSIKINRNAKNR